MKIGIFADTHDHLENMKRAVEVFNRRMCDLVIFAGDFVSPIVIPPLRQLECPMLACYGDNEGNKSGVQAGMRIVGPLADPPFGFQTPDGTRVLVTHILKQLEGYVDEADVVIFAHTHKYSTITDKHGRLFINPGEASGWVFGKPTVAILETPARKVECIELNAPAEAAT